MSKSTAGTIRLALRLDKTSKKDGKAPVELIYSLHGQRKRISTGVKILPTSWNESKNLVNYISKAEAKKFCPELPYNDLPSESEVEQLNAELALKKKDIARAENLIGEDQKFNSEMIAAAVRVTSAKKSRTEKVDAGKYMVDFIENLVEESKATRNLLTLKAYTSTCNHLKNFELAKRLKITLEDANYGFLQSFYNYLISEIDLINVTASKHVTILKTLLSFARKHGFQVNQSYHDFNIKSENLEVIALTENEFLAIYNIDLSGNKRLAQVRDVFCFSCVTGLRYSDLAQLRREHIKGHEIHLTVTKTREIIKVPLNSYSIILLDRYRLHLRPLPVISNQKLNVYIKELCQMVGIDEPVQIVRYKGAKRIENTYPKFELISAHTGRKTFATLSLEKGANAEEVMSMTGHRSYASFKRYVKITEERKKLVMRKAWGAPENLKVVEGGEG